MDIKKLVNKFDKSEWLTITQCKQYAGVSRQTIYDWIKSGMPYKQVGYFRLVQPGALMQMSKIKEATGTGYLLRGKNRKRIKEK